MDQLLPFVQITTTTFPDLLSAVEPHAVVYMLMSVGVAYPGM